MNPSPEKVISLLPAGIFILDRAGAILGLNPAAGRLLGARPRRLLGKKLASLFSPADAAGFGEALRQLAAGHPGPRRCEVVPQRAPGRHLEIILAADQEGQLLQGFIAVVREVTADRQEYVQLRQLAAVLESIQETVIITDRRRMIVYVNPAATKMLGYEPREMLKRPAARFFNNIDGNPPRLADFIESHSTELGWEGEVYNRRKDGRIIPVHLSLTPVIDQKGETVGYVGISHDISKIRELETSRRRYTEQVEAEVKKRTEELQKITRDMAGQRSQLDAILSNIAEGVVVENENFEVEFMNSTLIRQFGNQVGKKCYESFIGRKTPCPVCGVQAVIQERKDYFCYESVDKQGRYYELVASPLVRPDGRRLVIEIVRDITERKKTDELIRQKNLQLTEVIQELKKLLQVKSEFLSLISHELKSPLTVIQGYLTLLKSRQMGSLNPEQEEGLKVAAIEAEHLNYLINQILDLSQLDSGKFELVSEDIDIKTLVGHCVAALKREAKKGRISFRLRIPASFGVVRGDSNKIKQVFRNVIENALKFSPEGGTVTVTGLKRDDNLLFSVKDRGIGIPDSEVEKIFDRFYQVKNPYTIKYGGMGLGLAITKNIVELHGGRIWVESRMGKGTTVYFTLPLAKGGDDSKP